MSSSLVADERNKRSSWFISLFIYFFNPLIKWEYKQKSHIAQFKATKSMTDTTGSVSRAWAKPQLEPRDTCWDASAWSGAHGSGWHGHVSAEGQKGERISDGEGPAEAAGLVQAAPPRSGRSLAQNLHRKRVSRSWAWPFRGCAPEPASLPQGRGAQQGRLGGTGNHARLKRRARQTGQRGEPKLLRQQHRVLRDPRGRLHALRPGRLLPACGGFHPQGAQIPAR